VKRLKAKVRRVHKRKLGERYHVELQRAKELLAAKKLHREYFSGQYYEMEASAGLSSTGI
jgi:hypothetical protein